MTAYQVKHHLLMMQLIISTRETFLREDSIQVSDYSLSEEWGGKRLGEIYPTAGL